MWHIISRFNESTLLKYAGDMMVQQMKYNSGYDVAGEEDPTNRVFINTETTYRTGKFFFRNLASGARIRFDIPDYGGIEYDNDKVITYPANLLTADIPVFADTPVELKGKTFNVTNNTLTNIVNANIGAAAGIVYSKLNLTGGIVNADINASAGIVDSKLAQITNKAKLPNTTVYNDQANTYGSFLQTFIKGFIRLDDLAGHFTSFSNGTQTGNFVLSIPVLAANDTVATIGLTNTFNTFQKFVYNVSSTPIVLYRPSNTAGIGTGIAFNLMNSTPIETTYAALYGVVGSNAAGAETGSYSFQLKDAGAMAERMFLTSAGILAFGATNKAVLDPAGLTAQRTYTFQNASGKIPILEFANIFTEQQTIQKDTTVLLSLYRLNQTQGSSMGVTFDAWSSTGVKRSYGAIYSNMVAVTNGAENGQLWFQTMSNGTLATRLAVNHNGYLFVGTTQRLVFLDTGLTAQRLFTHPDTAGETTINEAAQTLLAKTLTTPIINGGVGAALNGSFTTNALTINRTAVATNAEVLQTWQVSDDSTSYLQINNATANDGQFSPRITTYNALASNNAAVGFYLYSNVATTSDSADSSNAVTVFDSRRSDSTAILNRRLFQFRNAGTNVLQIYTNTFDFTSKTIENAIININQSTIKHSTTNAEGDLYFYDNALAKMSRLPRGANGDVLKSTATGIQWAANIITIANLDDIGNVAVTGAANGNILQFNGTNWVHSTIGTNGEANTGANAGTGAGVFKDKTAAQLNFRSLLAATPANITVTQNTNDITIALATNIILPSAVNTPLTFTKPNSGASGAEKLARFTVDDDPNGSEITIENMTSAVATFAPGLLFSQYSSNAMAAGYILGRIDDTHDIVNEAAVIQLNARRNAAAIVNRPLVEITTFSTKEYLFYIDKFDMKGNSLQNAVIHSTVTGIANANIDAAAAIATSKLADSANFAMKNVANIFTEAQKISKNTATNLTLHNNTGTQFSQNQLDFTFQDSTPAEVTFARIGVSLEQPLNSARRSFIGFSYYNANVFARRGMFFDNKLWIGTAGNQIVFDPAGVTGDRQYTFPDASQAIIGALDTRLTDARTPVAHVTSHQLDGSDPLILKGVRVARKLVSSTSNSLSSSVDSIVHVDCATAGANVTLTLPAASGRAGHIYWIQKIDSGAFTVIIDGNASETINGSTTYVLTAQYQMVMLMCDGANWTTGPYSSERRGRSTASGNAAAVTFNVPHGLGAVPHDVIITCSSHNTALTYTYDATNIIVVFASAPPTGTNNVVFNWSAVP